jgi:hypothetical protein
MRGQFPAERLLHQRPEQGIGVVQSCGLSLLHTSDACAHSAQLSLNGLRRHGHREAANLFQVETGLCLAVLRRRDEPLATSFADEECSKNVRVQPREQAKNRHVLTDIASSVWLIDTRRSTNLRAGDGQ